MPVAPEANYGSSSLAVGPGGELYVALSRFDPSGAIGIEVLRSQDGGGSFEAYGTFADSNPEHNFAAPALVHLDNPQRLVMAMLEHVPAAGYAVRIARTPIGPEPDWRVTTVGWGETLIEPEIAVDPGEPERLYVIYRAFRVNQSLNVEVDFSRSTNGGTTWSPPFPIGATVLPEEMTSASVLAAPDSVVHVAWVATRTSGSAIYHRRHLGAGDPAIPFESQQAIIGPDAEVADVHLGAGSGPEVLALYLAGDRAIRAAWSLDAGTSFPISNQTVVSPFELPDELGVAGEGAHVHLIYRAFQSQLRYRPLLVAEPTGTSVPSIVSDIGEPAGGPMVALRRGVGPGVVWLAGAPAAPRGAFMDASWFETTGADGSDNPPAELRAAIIGAPNPFRRSMAVDLRVDEAAPRARVTVVSASGRHVATLYDGPLAAGNPRFHWDGRRARGEPAPAGVYYLEAALPGGTVRTRAVLLR